MTEIERSKWPPPEDDAMLPWYAGLFDQGFIALHPFFEVEGLDPAVCDHGTLVSERAQMPEDVGLIEWMDEAVAARREGKELFSGSIPAVAKQFGRPISWREVIGALNLPDHCELDRALRTHIKGLRRDLADEHAAEAVVAHCASHRIFLPTEGVMQPLLEARLVALLHRAGLSDIVVADEFGDDEVLMSVDALGGVVPWEMREDLPKWGVRRLMAPDRSLLVWVHWDSFYTAIFGTKERLSGARVPDGFEGFWCSDLTTTYWLKDEAVPLVQ